MFLFRGTWPTVHWVESMVVRVALQPCYDALRCLLPKVLVCPRSLSELLRCSRWRSYVAASLLSLILLKMFSTALLDQRLAANMVARVMFVPHCRSRMGKRYRNHSVHYLATHYFSVQPPCNLTVFLFHFVLDTLCIFAVRWQFRGDRRYN